MKCKPVIDRRAIREERAEDFAKLDTMIDLIKADPFVRFGLGLPIDKKSNSLHEFNAWVKIRFGIDPMREILDTSTINHLMAEIIGIRQQARDQQTFKSRADFKAWHQRLFNLPQTVFMKRLVRGEDLWTRTQMLKHRADDRRITISAELGSLGGGFQKLTGVTAKAVDRVIGQAEGNLSAALDKQKLLRETGASKQELTDARIEVEKAKQELNALFRGEIEDKVLGTAVRLQRSIALTLNGKFGELDASGREVLRPLKIREAIVEMPSGPEMAEGAQPTVTRKVLDRQGLLKALRRQNPGIDWRTSTEAAGLVDSVAEFLSTFGETAKRGFDAEKNNLFHELTRGEAAMAPEQANDFINRTMNFDRLDLYFPQKALSHLSRLQSVVNGIRSAADKRAYLRGVIEHGDQVIFQREGTPHTRPRIVDYQRRDVSMNLFRVIGDYANEVVTYWHDNKLSSILNDYVGELFKLRDSLPRGVSRENYEDYLQGVQRYLAEMAEVSKNAPTGGKVEEMAKIATAMYAANKMGFLNPSTPVQNLVEGHAVMATRIGFDKLFPKGDRKNTWEKVVKPLIGKEYVDIIPGEQFMEYGEGSYGRLLKYMGEKDAARYGLVEKDTALRVLQRTRQAATKVATDAIILQTAAENKNRNRAFETGALMEYEFIEGRFRTNLMSQGANKIYTDADIRMMFPERSVADVRAAMRGPSSAREKLWTEFAKRRVIKAGYEFMYQTQWNYNQAARHFLEHAGPLPKLAMMFQHYPLSWLSAWQRTFYVLNNLRKAGGAKAMFHRDPRQRALYDRGRLQGTLGDKSKEILKRSTNLSYWTNKDMMFALSAGAVATTMMGIRYGTGIVFNQFWQHPLTEVVQDIVKYVINGFNGEEEKNKTLFWGRGALNEFTGPFYTDLMDAISLGAVKAGIDEGDMPRWTSDLLRGTLGFRPNELLLTQYGARRYNNAFDVMNEAFLFGSMSVAPKAARMATSVPRVGDDLYDLGVGPAYETLTGGKLRRKEDPGLNDFGGVLMRAMGIRDEKSIEEYLESRLKKEYKQ